jgi:hypothetical protein
VIAHDSHPRGGFAAPFVADWLIDRPANRL